MNKFEDQVLKNQLLILKYLEKLSPTSGFDKDLVSDEIDSTSALLLPELNVESACDMSDLDRMDAEEDAAK